MILAFKETEADLSKEWLKTYKEEEILDYNESETSIKVPIWNSSIFQIRIICGQLEIVWMILKFLKERFIYHVLRGNYIELGCTIIGICKWKCMLSS